MKFDISKLNDKSIMLLKFIETNGPQTQKVIIQRLNFPIRKVRYVLSRLIEDGFLKKIPNLSDMRSTYYHINPEISFSLDSVLSEQMLLI